jgi:hypothetical protein
MKKDQILKLARIGASYLLDKAEAEAAELKKFLIGGKERKRRMKAAPKPKRRGMTAAQRKAVSKRMKAYWAARRKNG